MADSLLLVSTGESFLHLLFALFAFGVVIVATYYVSKWISGYQKNLMSNGNFEIVDSLRFSPSKFIVIVRVGTDKYYVIGVGKDEFEMLGELSGDELVMPEKAYRKMGRSMDFSSLLGSFRQFKETSEHHEDED